MSDYDDREEHELLVPFVCVESVGGPYDDDSFAAGFAMGQLWSNLSSRRIAATTEMVRRESCRQADLIAMHHGYTCDIRHTDDEWRHLGFTRLDEEQSA